MGGRRQLKNVLLFCCLLNGKSGDSRTFSKKAAIKQQQVVKNEMDMTNKFHSKYVCFGREKTREERKIYLKIRLFGFPQRLVIGSPTTAARKVVSSSNLIGPFKIWARAQIQRPLEDETTFRAAVVANPTTSLWGKPKRRILRQFFRSSRVFRAPN